MMTKKKILSLFALTSFALAPMASHAQSPNPQQIVQQGLENRLSASDARDLQNWIVTAQSILRDAQQKLPHFLNPKDSLQFLADTFATAVPDYAQHYQDTLLRYALNRAMLMKHQMDQMVSDRDPTKISQELRVMKKSIDIAVRYSSYDLSRLAMSRNPLPFGEFAVEEADALLLINESDISPSQHLELALEVIGWLHVDLSKDESQNQFQDPIGRIFDLLKDDSVADLQKNPIRGLQVVRTTYFSVLTDLMRTSTPVGDRIREIQTRDKRIRVDRRIPKL